MSRSSTTLACFGVVALTFVGGCGTDHHDAAPPPVAVLSAFPAETAPLLAQTSVESTAMVNGHLFRIGTLAGVRVVIGLTGIGLLNAAATTHALLEQFAVSGIVVSAVAGSTVQIGDVVIPNAWELKDGSTFAANGAWLQLTQALAASNGLMLDRCTVVANPPPDDPVCMLEQPAIVLGGVGQSTDPFDTTPFPCQPDGGDIYGCDVPAGSAATELLAERVRFATADAAAPIVNDMETAAIAREAAARGVPFIAFRGISDGGGDPLNLPGGFLGQFPAYYRFAAHNAALATVAFLRRLPPAC